MLCLFEKLFLKHFIFLKNIYFKWHLFHFVLNLLLLGQGIYLFVCLLSDCYLIF